MALEQLLDGGRSSKAAGFSALHAERLPPRTPAIMADNDSEPGEKGQLEGAKGRAKRAAADLRVAEGRRRARSCARLKVRALWRSWT